MKIKLSKQQWFGIGKKAGWYLYTCENCGKPIVRPDTIADKNDPHYGMRPNPKTPPEKIEETHGICQPCYEKRMRELDDELKGFDKDSKSSKTVILKMSRRSYEWLKSMKIAARLIHPCANCGYEIAPPNTIDRGEENETIMSHTICPVCKDKTYRKYFIDHGIMTPEQFDQFVIEQEKEIIEKYKNSGLKPPRQCFINDYPELH